MISPCSLLMVRQNIFYDLYAILILLLLESCCFHFVIPVQMGFTERSSICFMDKEFDVRILRLAIYCHDMYVKHTYYQYRVSISLGMEFLNSEIKITYVTYEC